MKLARAILAVAMLAVLLALSCNGKDGGEPDGEGTVPVADVIAGADESARYAGGSHSDAPGDEAWPTWPESASVVRDDYVRLSCPVIVYTNPDGVWEILTTVRSFSMWYPHWEQEEGMLRRLTAVGDTVCFHLDGKVAGRSVVTWIDPSKDLRIVHELAEGGVYGFIQVSLDRAERGVGMTYVELLPSAGLDLPNERRRVCRQAILIKRLAEGE